MGTRRMQDEVACVLWRACEGVRAVRQMSDSLYLSRCGGHSCCGTDLKCELGTPGKSVKLPSVEPSLAQGTIARTDPDPRGMRNKTCRIEQQASCVQPET